MSYKLPIFISTTSYFIKNNKEEGKVDWVNKLYKRLKRNYSPYLYSEDRGIGKPKKILEAEIQKSLIFLGVYNHRAGTKLSDNKNDDRFIIHWEYEYAKEKEKAIIPMIITPLLDISSDEVSHKKFMENKFFLNPDNLWKYEFSCEADLISIVCDVLISFISEGYNNAYNQLALKNKEKEEKIKNRIYKTHKIIKKPLTFFASGLTIFALVIVFLKNTPFVILQKKQTEIPAPIILSIISLFFLFIFVVIFMLLFLFKNRKIND